MERKYLDRPNWQRVLKKKFYLSNIQDGKLDGCLSALYIEKVRESLIKSMVGRAYCLVNDGYIWLEYLPSKANYCVTAMINEKSEVVQWYFDIIKSSGIDERGIPYFDDLYLDVVALPTHDILLLDEDELKEALDSKDITIEDFDLAYIEANRIIKSLDIEELKKLTNSYLKYIKGLSQAIKYEELPMMDNDITIA